MVWGSGEVARISLGHRLPGAISAQQLKVFLFQILSPIISVLSWGQKKGFFTLAQLPGFFPGDRDSQPKLQGSLIKAPTVRDVTGPLACGGPGSSGQQKYIHELQ